MDCMGILAPNFGAAKKKTRICKFNLSICLCILFKLNSCFSYPPEQNNFLPKKLLFVTPKSLKKKTHVSEWIRLGWTQRYTQSSWDLPSERNLR